MKLAAPAKVNLSLKIPGKRPDGFHEIESLMCSLTLADEMEISVAGGQDIVVTTNDPTLPTDGGNLATRAARQFLDKAGITRSVTIHIDKRIPVGAGLGGGSSDAASVLLALDSMVGTNFSRAELIDLAAAIGSDVPFFISGEASWARGRGERLEPTEVPAGIPILLIKPGFGVSTPWAYSRWQVARSLDTQFDASQSAFGLEIFNDLERPVFEKFLVLPAIRRWLAQQDGVMAALMSGSGSTMFGICDSVEQLRRVEAAAQTEFGRAYWIHSCQTR